MKINFLGGRACYFLLYWGICVWFRPVRLNRSHGRSEHTQSGTKLAYSWSQRCRTKSQQFEDHIGIFFSRPEIKNPNIYVLWAEMRFYGFYHCLQGRGLNISAALWYHHRTNETINNQHVHVRRASIIKGQSPLDTGHCNDEIMNVYGYNLAKSTKLTILTNYLLFLMKMAVILQGNCSHSFPSWTQEIMCTRKHVFLLMCCFLYHLHEAVQRKRGKDRGKERERQREREGKRGKDRGKDRGKERGKGRDAIKPTLRFLHKAVSNPLFSESLLFEANINPYLLSRSVNLIE